MHHTINIHSWTDEGETVETTNLVSVRAARHVLAARQLMNPYTAMWLERANGDDLHG